MNDIDILNASPTACISPETSALSYISETAKKLEFAFILLDGNNIRDKQSLLSEFAGALEFPPYFGHNWDAFEECMMGIDTKTGGKGCIIVFTKPELLFNSDKTAFEVLIEILKNTASRFKSRNPAGFVIRFFFATDSPEIKSMI